MEKMICVTVPERIVIGLTRFGKAADLGLSGALKAGSVPSSGPGVLGLLPHSRSCYCRHFHPARLPALGFLFQVLKTAKF
jgi:hypothetical protein